MPVPYPPAPARTPRRLLPALLLLCAACVLPARAASATDLILTNAAVYTPEGWREAVAIDGAVITAVGTAAEIARLRGPTTRVVDLAGATLLPGLHDMHVHSYFAGMEQFQCRFEYGAAPPAMLARVRECVAGARPGEWIEGGNWAGAAFAPGQQTRAALDAVAPDNPVMLNDEAHHSLWVNSRALALAGITRATAAPAGGVIERDAQGEPTGVLRETATQLVQKAVPLPSDEARRRAVVLSSTQMLAYGITSYTEASVRANNLATLSSLSRDGLLKQHVRGCIVWAPGNAEAERYLAERARWATPRFATDCVKLFLDGVPTESHTAAMLEPYQPPRGRARDAHDRGLLMIPQATLDAAVARFDRMGLHVKFHAVGDAAVRSALDAIAHARAVNGWGGPMHEIGHSTFVAPRDVPRARELQAAWEFSPYIWYPTPMVSVDVHDAVGDARMARFIPIRDALASGALVVAGSDWSVVPSVNPWAAMETMVTRAKPGGGADTVAPGQRITREQAFALFTVNAARLMGRRDRVGSIEPGMRADLVVTERNPLQVPIAELHATRVLATWIDGQQVYDASAPPPLTAR